MSDDCPLHLSGCTYFFTVRLQDDRTDLLVTQIDLLRDATRLCMKRWPFGIDAAVILPNRLHMIWTLPEYDRDFSKRWRMIKSTFARHAQAHIPPCHARRGATGIWQRRDWEHKIRDTYDYGLHMHLIRSAPINAGLARKAGEWPHTSLHHRSVAQARRRFRTIAPVPSVPDPVAVVTAS